MFLKLKNQICVQDNFSLIPGHICWMEQTQYEDYMLCHVSFEVDEFMVGKNISKIIQDMKVCGSTKIHFVGHT